MDRIGEAVPHPPLRRCLHDGPEKIRDTDLGKGALHVRGPEGRCGRQVLSPAPSEAASLSRPRAPAPIPMAGKSGGVGRSLHCFRKPGLHRLLHQVCSGQDTDETGPAGRPLHSPATTSFPEHLPIGAIPSVNFSLQSQALLQRLSSPVLLPSSCLNPPSLGCHSPKPFSTSSLPPSSLISPFSPSHSALTHTRPSILPPSLHKCHARLQADRYFCPDAVIDKERQ